MKSVIYLFLFAVSLFVVTSCGKIKSSHGLIEGLDDTSEEYMNTTVNAIDQSLPEIIVLPSDGVLLHFGAAKQTSEGVQRDYQKYLFADRNNKTIVSALQELFISNNYPLTDLEQTLKSLSTSSTTDETDYLEKDAKTLLLETAHPDIIVEVDYISNLDRKTYNTTLNYTLQFIDPYTNKVFATKSVTDVNGKNTGDAFKNSLSDQIKDINKDIRKYFSSILTKGREVHLRISVSMVSNISLQNESVDGKTYTDWVEDYLDTHTVKGSFNLRTNTQNELSFSVRIPTLNEDGTQYSAYQWGRELANAMNKQLGVKVSNRTQGLANIHLVITGI